MLAGISIQPPPVPGRRCSAMLTGRRKTGFRVAGAFALDPERASRFSIDAAGLTLDYSKQRIDTQTMQLLLALAAERNVAGRRDAMFAGEKVNTTEHRAVLHVALREPAVGARQHIVDGVDVVPAVHAELAACARSASRYAPARGAGARGGDHRCREHWHRWFRSWPADGVRGAATRHPPAAQDTLCLQRRWRRS